MSILMKQCSHLILFRKKRGTVDLRISKTHQESRHMKPLALIAAIESERGLVAYAIHKGSINSENFCLPRTAESSHILARTLSLS